MYVSHRVDDLRGPPNLERTFDNCQYLEVLGLSLMFVPIFSLFKTRYNQKHATTALYPVKQAPAPTVYDPVCLLIKRWQCWAKSWCLEVGGPAWPIAGFVLLADDLRNGVLVDIKR